MFVSCFAVLTCVVCTPSGDALAQGFRQSAGGPGVVSKVEWSEDGKSVEFTNDGQRFRFDLESNEKAKVEAKKKADDKAAPTRFRRRARQLEGNTGKYLGRPSRGRQYTKVESPDGKWVAEYKDWNLVLENKESKDVVDVTTDGNEHVHYGTASWVYGEELDQNKAMWWTADSKKSSSTSLTIPT